MYINKQIILLITVSLLAVSCSKAPVEPVSTINTSPEDSTVTNLPVTSNVPKDWKPFSVSAASSFSVVIPPKWSEDKATTNNHFILRSRLNADGTKLGDTLMEFTTKPTVGKSLSDQVLADVAYGKSVSKPILGKTESGLEYAFVTFSDPSSAVKNWSGYAIGLSKSAYVFILAASNGENADIATIVKSVKLKN